MKRININLIRFKLYLKSKFSGTTVSIYFQRIYDYQNLKTWLNDLFSYSKSYIRQVKAALKAYSRFELSEIKITDNKVIFNCAEIFKISGKYVAKLSDCFVIFSDGLIKHVVKTIYEATLFVNLLGKKPDIGFLNDNIVTGNFELKLNQ